MDHFQPFRFCFLNSMLNKFLTFKMPWGNLVTPTSAKPTASSPEHNANTSAPQCSICRETLGEPSPEGEIEKAYIFPCSHVFGSACITRWLDTSPHKNCPTCRRSLIYKICGHPIEPFDASKQPQYLQVEEMPERCLLCRQGGVWEERLALLTERQLAEERILLGLGLFLQTSFGRTSGTGVESFGGRLEESRQRFKADVELTRSVLEQEVGKAW